MKVIPEYVFGMIEVEERMEEGKKESSSQQMLLDKCPECGSILIYQEGCHICPSCGYTKCG